MDRKWYESFFRGIALDMWRQAFTPEQTRAEADFLERALRLPPAARVLDVPCGNGRHALELASRGHRVTGVDLSSEQIADAGARAAAAGRHVEWRLADMRELPWTSEFDGAYCFGNSLGYFEPAGTRAFLEAIARVLKPGGTFVIDTGLAAESILPHLQARGWMRFGDILFLEENRYDPVESCLGTTYTFVRGGETHTQTGWLWVHTVRELRSFFDAAGLEVKQILSALDGTPFQVGSQYLVLVTEKAM